MHLITGRISEGESVRVITEGDELKVLPNHKETIQGEETEKIIDHPDVEVVDEGDDYKH